MNKKRGNLDQRESREVLLGTHYQISGGVRPYSESWVRKVVYQDNASFFKSFASDVWES